MYHKFLSQFKIQTFVSRVALNDGTNSHVSIWTYPVQADIRANEIFAKMHKDEVCKDSYIIKKSKD